MAKNSGLVQRNGWYYFRRRIPTDISTLIKSDFSVWKRLAVNPGSRLFDWRSIATKERVKREWLTSLQTTDRREAGVLFHQQAAEIEEVFQIIRAAYSGSTRSPTDQDLRELAKTHFQKTDDKSSRDYSDLALLASGGHQLLENAIEDYNAANPQDPVYTGYLQSLAKSLLTNHEYAVELQFVNRLGAYLARAERLLLIRDIERAQGKFSDLPSDEILVDHKSGGNSDYQPSQAKSKSLQEAYKLYRQDAEEDETHPKTIRKFDYVWRLLGDIFGAEFPIRDLNREKARLFAETVKALPANWTKNDMLGKLSALEAAEKAKELGIAPCNINTANGYIARFSSFLKFARDEDLIFKNFASGLVRKPNRQKIKRSRHSFTVDELQRIFGANYRDVAQFRGRSASSQPVKGCPRDPRYWAPLISLFTGMRIHEICQLTKHEVRQIDGVWCIRVTWFLERDLDDEEDNEPDDDEVFRSMKTPAAERAIPIIPQLIDLGFIEFVSTTEGGPTQRIFPQLKPDKDGYLAEPVSRWFARHLDSIGIPETVKQVWSDPLLRYSRVLDGLFHDGVIVCEGDADCRFYGAMIDAVSESAPMADLHLVYGAGKSRIATIVAALRAIGVPVRVVVDFDVISDTTGMKGIVEALGGKWIDFEKDHSIVKAGVETKRAEVQTDEARQEIKDALQRERGKTLSARTIAQIKGVLRKSSAWSEAKRMGKTFVPNGDAANAYARFSEALRARGVFLVEVGELEGFYRRSSKHGPSWVTEVLERDIINDPELREAREFALQLATDW